MGEKIELYQPSNGTVGESFKSHFCYRCSKCPSPEADNQCGIMLRTMAFSPGDKEYPNQWRYVDGKPVCTSFKHRDEFNEARRQKRKPTKDKQTLDLF